MAAHKNILVIKLSALGDFIQAMGPMAAIRRHHPNAQITLLTTKNFENFAAQCGYFNQVLIDDRPTWYDLPGWINLRAKLNAGNFDRVYDLQNNDRSCFYFKLFSGAQKPEWVGIAKGASHQNTSPERIAGHAFDGHVQTLALAGIKDVQIDKLDWLEESISHFALQKPYILLVPGCAPQHPQKRWPTDKYGRLCNILVQWGYQVVVLGTKSEKTIAVQIKEACPQILDLTSQTSLAQIVTLARGAAGAIGNDTGPMHLIAPTGCPTLVLFSSYSNPAKHAPKGETVDILQRDDLKDLRSEEILNKLKPREEPKEPSKIMH